MDDAQTRNGKETTRDHLLAVAKREFAENGYKGTSVRKICELAGVSSGALYFSFKSKDDLFRSVIAPLVEPARAILSEFGPEGYAYALMASTYSEDKPLNLAGTDRLLTLCYEHKDLVDLMIANRDTPVVEELVSYLSSTLKTDLAAYVTSCGASLDVWDDLLLSWLVGSSLESFERILATDDTLEKAGIHLGRVAEFLRGGIAQLLAVSIPDEA